MLRKESGTCFVGYNLDFQTTYSVGGRSFLELCELVDDVRFFQLCEIVQNVLSIHLFYDGEKALQSLT